MNDVDSGQAQWSLAFLNTGVFVGFAYSFFKPSTATDWKVFGAYSAFVAALFAEVYGFPLTIFLFRAWLSAAFPDVDMFGHEARHLWWLLWGPSDPHMGALRFLSFAIVFAGFLLLAMAWHALQRAQRREEIASTGPYRRIRHPQYGALIIIMLGLLFYWPTLPSMLLLPLLVVMYVRLARSEEQELIRERGEAWRSYAAATPRFLPALHGDCR
ncbi:isoprenylcysteine carboxylmethyltransferase family protein [Variovorax rhizosphaerae]|uniref:Isoprenylcysteine carboxylmethyltransferase family protein n=1 Tax=Variovorax rhizosphaerae TaxID=1836200 RepID=A0ABU8WRQ2_9BURK